MALIAEIPLNDDLRRPSNSTVSSESAKSYYFQGKYQEAISIWLGLLNSVEPKTRAKIQGYLGAAYKQSGQLEEAVSHLRAAMAIYQDLNSEPELTKIKVDLAQAYNSLGQPQKAIPLLNEASAFSKDRKDSAIFVVAMNALATSYLIEGNYDEAIENYQKSLGKAQEDEITGILNNLTSAYNLRSAATQKIANLAETEGDRETQAINSQKSKQDKLLALDTASLAVKTKKNDIASVSAMLNEMKLTKTGEYVERIQQILKHLPPSRDKAYAIISLAQLLPDNQAIEALQVASAISQQINDRRTLSEALGNLGKLYISTQPTLALKYTQQAQNAAQVEMAFDLLYRWLWQAGRIYWLQGKTTEAIPAYKGAIASLQTIRQNVNNANSELQLDFTSEIQPVYRELIEILLKSDSTDFLKEALSIFELFQISELQDFFGDDCVISVPANSQEVLASTNTAVVYSIILDDLTYLILQLPSGQTFKYPIQISRTSLEQQVKLWRQELENISTNQYFDLSKSLYSKLFQPLESQLTTASVSTLLFVNDGILRNVPMAALHDGEKFLIQKYAIASSLGLNFSLKPVAPSANLNPLIFGITQGIPPFSPLPFVEKEVNNLSKIKKSKTFLNQDFNQKNLTKQLFSLNYSLLHIATHGKFGGSAQSSFLQAFNQKIGLEDLQELLAATNNQIELLTLSACQTAAGNDRSVLGLGGIAIRTGVKTVVGSLWSVNDSMVVSLITDFYDNLFINKLNRAEALRAAQLNLISQNKAHPAIWSNLVLLGSW